MIDPAYYTAYIASRLCHDLVNPASSVASAIGMMDETDLDEELRQSSEVLLRDNVKRLEATLLFLRYAFGNMGMSDSVADMHEAKRVTEDYVAMHKPHLDWDIDTAHFSYFHARLMMHMVLIAISSLPRGGNMTVRIKDQNGKPCIAVHAIARSDRPGIEATATVKPEVEAALSTGAAEFDWKAQTIQPLFAANIAEQLGTRLTVNKLSETEIILAANEMPITAKINAEGLS
ncbi:MAG: histidine phosphotransferase family protein [Pseudomonadota bacterium]